VLAPITPNKGRNCPEFDTSTPNLFHPTSLVDEVPRRADSDMFMRAFIKMLLELRIRISSDGICMFPLLLQTNTGFNVSSAAFLSFCLM
jgi:hypothetical protein